MLEMRWLDHLPNGDLQEGLVRSDDLYWFISVNTDGKRWVIRAGSSVILHTDSLEVANAFLYGFGLAYSIIPEPEYSQVKEAIIKEVGLGPEDQFVE
jgi:hypothetical protein